jgi:hypothetical protein
LIGEKTRGRKSRDSVPLIAFFLPVLLIYQR